MLTHIARGSCHACHQALPRAASHRCPSCREPIRRLSDGGEIICHRCKGLIPRAHAGQCPSCAVKDMRSAWRA